MRFYLFAVFGDGGRRQQETITAFPTPGRGAKYEQSFYFSPGWIVPWQAAPLLRAESTAESL